MRRPGFCLAFREEVAVSAPEPPVFQISTRYPGLSVRWCRETLHLLTLQSLSKADREPRESTHNPLVEGDAQLCCALIRASGKFRDCNGVSL